MNDEASDAVIDAGAALLGIDVKPEWRQDVRTSLAILLGHAETVCEGPLPDDLDPAPVYRA